MSIAHSHHPQVIHSLFDILEWGCDVDTGVQEYSNIYAVWALLTMFRRSSYLQDSVVKLTIEEL